MVRSFLLAVLVRKKFILIIHACQKLIYTFFSPHLKIIASGLCGIPENLIQALKSTGKKELTIVSNNAGMQIHCQQELNLKVIHFFSTIRRR
jgi:hypothetical protein